jgi:sulfite exporter TauE/SafE
MQAKTEYECRKGWTKAKSYKLAGSTMAITGATLSSSIPVLGVLFLLFGSALALYGLYMEKRKSLLSFCIN